MKVVLELQDQPSNIKRVTVRHDIVIGRGAECNLRLSAPQVSRRHCFLRVGGDAASITDLESSNGTFIDGQRITAGKRYMLRDGMSIAVGPIRFITRIQSKVAAASSGFLKIEASDETMLTDNDQSATARTSFSSDQLPDASNAAVSSPMDLAVEHAGPSAEEDEPTAGYDSDVQTKAGPGPDRMPEVLDSEMEIVDLGRRAAARESAMGFDSDEEPETLSDAGIGSTFAAQSADAPDVEVLDDIEVVDDAGDVVVVDDVEVVEDAEVVDVHDADDDDVLDIAELADDEIVDIADEDGVTGSWFDNDDRSTIRSDDSELDDFLKGLP
ncbi:MAG: FHA domain-containing protein [Planctomycetaceae bacterium]